MSLCLFYEVNNLMRTAQRHVCPSNAFVMPLAERVLLREQKRKANFRPRRSLSDIVFLLRFPLSPPLLSSLAAQLRLHSPLLSPHQSLLVFPVERSPHLAPQAVCSLVLGINTKLLKVHEHSAISEENQYLTVFPKRLTPYVEISSSPR